MSAQTNKEFVRLANPTNPFVTHSFTLSLSLCLAMKSLCSVLFLVTCLVLAVCRADETADNNNNDSGKSVTVLGLGIMGQALSKCFASHGYTVHT